MEMEKQQVLSAEASAKAGFAYAEKRGSLIEVFPCITSQCYLGLILTPWPEPSAVSSRETVMWKL
jgi:hypothetical protein